MTTPSDGLPVLSPAQRRALDGLLGALPVWSLAVVSAPTGRGRTSVLRAAHRVTGGAFLTLSQFLDVMNGRHPLAIEETFHQWLLDALRQQDTVYLDDLHVLTEVVASESCATYPRRNYLDTSLLSLATYALEQDKTLVFGSAGHTPEPVDERCYYAQIEDFKEADYQALCTSFWRTLGTPAPPDSVDYDKIYRFAPNLNAHQLKGACAFVTPAGRADTERLIDYLRSQQMASNVDLEEVQQVELTDLKGVDDVLSALEANIIIPLENDALATELDLKPKRGVLLAGPPGTGKTSIGRALAHRLKGKFFLIDGTFISGTGSFYQSVHHVFHRAKQNAPSVIFIDDSDVIFENREEAGLYRYLLTMLDGLESHSAGRVCVMMTAMNVNALPPALIRSGRVELWLETRLPDAAGRAAILRDLTAKLPSVIRATMDVETLTRATDGMTGADLKRLVDDGKIGYAYDRTQGRPTRPSTEYFLEAVKTVRENKERYAKADARARKRRKSRPPWFQTPQDRPVDDDDIPF